MASNEPAGVAGMRDFSHDHRWLSINTATVRQSQGRELPLPDCGVVALEGDADGWVVRSWAGTPLG